MLRKVLNYCTVQSQRRNLAWQLHPLGPFSAILESSSKLSNVQCKWAFRCIFSWRMFLNITKRSRLVHCPPLDWNILRQLKIERNLICTKVPKCFTYYRKIPLGRTQEPFLINSFGVSTSNTELAEIIQPTLLLCILIYLFHSGSFQISIFWLKISVYEFMYLFTSQFSRNLFIYHNITFYFIYLFK